MTTLLCKLDDSFGDQIRVHTDVGGKLLNGDQLVVFFAEVLLYVCDQHAAIAISLACDDSHVLRVDDNALKCCHVGNYCK